MKRIQWLDTECSKTIRDINALSDLVQELWCEDDFEPDLDYVEHAQQIMDRPASRRVAARRSSYMEMKALVAKIVVESNPVTVESNPAFLTQEEVNKQLDHQIFQAQKRNWEVRNERYERKRKLALKLPCVTP
jgi:hypothetical protein